MFTAGSLLVVLLIVLAVGVVYFVAPDADTEWVWLTPGSVVATALWIAASEPAALRYVRDGVEAEVSLTLDSETG